MQTKDLHVGYNFSKHDEKEHFVDEEFVNENQDCWASGCFPAAFIRLFSNFFPALFCMLCKGIFEMRTKAGDLQLWRSSFS